MSRTFAHGVTGQALNLEHDRNRLLALAQDVAIARGVEMCATMVHLAAARSLVTDSPFGANATVSCVKAAVQDRTGVRGYQAAHLLPGTITINGRFVWLIVPTRPKPISPAHQWEPPARKADGSPVSSQDLLRLASQLQLGFAQTAVLPTAINVSDSAAEKRPEQDGLKALFGARVQALWSSKAFLRDKPLQLDRTVLYAALSGWFADLSRHYLSAAVGKRQKSQDASTVVTEARRLVEADILETYARSFVIANVGRFMEKEIGAVLQRYAWLPTR